MTEKLPSVLFSASEIATRIREMSEDIAKNLPKDLFIVSILKGSFVFTADLMRALFHLGIRPEIDFITLSSYAKGMSAGEIILGRGIAEDVRGREVLLVDDILESGGSLNYARQMLNGLGAANVHIAALLEKPGKRRVEIEAEYVGFKIPDVFVVGYGLDYANRYRELPYIGSIDSEDSSSS